MNELELRQVAVFSLERAARRIRSLAEQTRTADLIAELRGLADAIDGHARALLTPRQPAG